MISENIDFSLSPKNLEEIPFEKYVKNFTFIVNGKRYKTSRFVADILSPLIRKLHFVDESVDEFYINSSNVKENELGQYNEQPFEEDFFIDFLNLATFQNCKIDPRHKKYFTEYFSILGNIDEYFRIQPEFFSSLSAENVIDRLLSIIEITSYLSQDYSKKALPINEIIPFISSHFECIDKKQMKMLPVEILEEIISNEALQLQDEDSLLRFVLSMYDYDRSFSSLFEYIIFLNISEDLLESFIEKFDVEHINDKIWKSICYRLLPSKIDSANFKSRYRKLNLENRYQKIIKEFTHQPGNEFQGIMRYLTNETGGNIHDNGTIEITSNSINNNNPRYHSKNLVDYENNNYYHSSNDGGTTICFDFKDKLVQLTSYSIKSYSTGSNSDHLRNWVLEVSKDGKNWIEGDRHENDKKLNGANITATFNIKEQDNNFYRFIRLRQTGFSWYNYPYNNNYYFVVYSIEFYGKLQQHSLK